MKYDMQNVAACRTAGYNRNVGGKSENAMAEYNYTVIIEREEDGGYHAFCPAPRGCYSQWDI
jgi:hypothetical protein